MADDITQNQQYPLFLARRTFRSRQRDQGIELEAEGLRFTQGVRRHRHAYTDILSVNLTMMSLPRLYSWARTTIRFRDGSSVAVCSTDQWRMSSDELLAEYRRFNASLHDHIVRSGVSEQVECTIGPDPRLRRWLEALCVASVALFVGTPLWILAETGGEGRTTQIVILGLIFAYCALRTAIRNEPRVYSPYDPPDITV